MRVVRGGHAGVGRRGLDRLVFHVLAVLAEFIRELIVQGTHEGPAAARARGERIGRPPAMTEEQIRHARALLAQPDNTITSIAKLLGVSRTALYKYVPELAAGRDSLAPGAAGATLTLSAQHPGGAAPSGECSHQGEQSVGNMADREVQSAHAQFKERQRLLTGCLGRHSGIAFRGLGGHRLCAMDGRARGGRGCSAETEPTIRWVRSALSYPVCRPLRPVRHVSLRWSEANFRLSKLGTTEFSRAISCHEWTYLGEGRGRG